MTQLGFPTLRERSIQEAFMAYHDRHPEVYAMLIELAERAKAMGRNRIGISMLWETMRWMMHVEKSEEFKLNNNYRSRYVRMICRDRGDLAVMFEMRELRAV